LPDGSVAPGQRVLTQLVEALLSERLLPLMRRPEPLRGPLKRLEFGLGDRRYAASARLGAFGRVRLVPHSIARLDGGQAGLVGWREIAEELPAPVRRRNEIIEELAATERLCEWNSAHLKPATSRRHQRYDELEGSLVEGHPYHPCFKARTGFSTDDHHRYGPEARQTIELAWLGVRRSEAKQTLPCAEQSFWEKELGSETFGVVRRALDAAGLSLDDYALMPSHPWQAARLRTLAPGALESGSVVELGVRTGAYRAAQSVRTLMNTRLRRAADIKLPLATRISSSLRVFEPECVSAAPAISEWLARIVAGDAFFAEVQSLAILREYASSYHTSRAFGGHLGVIFRESVDAELGPFERAVPFNAVFAREHDQRPFIDDWVARHGLGHWLRRLLQVTVLPLWRLLVHHGVALEAHAQNLILVHRDGYPERLLVRDFHDSVEYVPWFLAAPANVPDFGALDARFHEAPVDRYYWMSSPEELRELFADTLFVFNLSELANLLFEQYELPEQRFWAVVRGVLDEYPLTGDDARRVRDLSFHAPRVRVESLFARRLHDAAEGRLHHLVDNPLHEPSKGTACSSERRH
jgi:3,4-dihydroxybenzoyl-citryl-spermidine/N-citryl-spermidine--spermidine ligase